MPLVEANLVPDFLVRFGIRCMLGGMITEQSKGTPADHVARKIAYVKDLKKRPIAESTSDANKQHYEVSAAFYDLCLGDWKKYSCGFWGPNARTLLESEEAALHMVCERAQITNERLKVLDMGCGWGSATLFIASHYPNVQVTSVSNSASQKAYIDDQARKRGLTNVTVVTCDINTFDTQERFDRVVSIEMMEHAKNYELLLAKVASWLKPKGKFFVHIFTHKAHPFHYIDGWMAENFFTGGQMPSDDLLLHFQRDVQLLDHWIVPGTHYEKTCNAWLAKLDSNKEAALVTLSQIYGEKDKVKWLVNWRLFFIACAELFAYNKGTEWAVSHYLFEKPVRA